MSWGWFMCSFMSRYPLVWPLELINWSDEAFGYINRVIVTPSVSCDKFSLKPYHQFWWNFPCGPGMSWGWFMCSGVSRYPLFWPLELIDWSDEAFGYLKRVIVTPSVCGDTFSLKPYHQIWWNFACGPGMSWGWFMCSGVSRYPLFWPLALYLTRHLATLRESLLLPPFTAHRMYHIHLFVNGTEIWTWYIRTAVNGGSNYDSLKVAKCRAYRQASKMTRVAGLWSEFKKKLYYFDSFHCAVWN